MKEEINQNGCARHEELISVVYGEATDQETRSFQHHLVGCTECRNDYAAFNGIHNSLFAWREETVGARAHSTPTRAANAKPSALAAIREFFNLSPLWLKGAVAFASLTLCALALLAVMRSSDNPTPGVTVHKSDAEIEKLVESRTQERLETLKANSEINPTVAAAPETTIKSAKPPRKRPSINSTQVASNQKNRPLSKAERDQLAADLRLTETQEEADLDILSEGNRQED